MTFQKLASLIAFDEAGKSQVLIGDVRECLKVLVTIEAEYQVRTSAKNDWAPDGPFDCLSIQVAKKRTQMLKKLKPPKESK